MKSLIYLLCGAVLIFSCLLATAFVPAQLQQPIAMPLAFAAAFCLFEAVKSGLKKEKPRKTTINYYGDDFERFADTVRKIQDGEM